MKFNTVVQKYRFLSRIVDFILCSIQTGLQAWIPPPMETAMRQLNDMFKGLMFLQGHFVHPEDAASPPARGFAGDGGQHRSGQAAAAEDSSAIGHLALLGGRPMHAGHNLDRGEPFEPLGGAANDDAVANGRARR